MGDYKSASLDAKASGDEAFKNGEYAAAIGHYSAAIDFDNEDINHILYSNRSACYLATKERGKALKDGRKCTEINPKFGKGWGRVGAAEYALGRYKEAAESYQEGIDVEIGKAENERKGVDGLREGREKSLKEAKLKEDREERLTADKEERERKDRELDDLLGRGDQDGVQAKKEKAPDDVMADFFSDITSSTQETVVNKITQPQDKYTNQDLSPFDNKSVIEEILQKNYKWKNLNPFRVFRLGVDANIEDIKLRYKRLSGRTHPDKNINDKERAEKAFDEVKKCYEILKDDNRRELAISYVQAGEEMATREYNKSETLSSLDLENMKAVEVMKIFAQVEKGRQDLEQKELDTKKRERNNEDADRDKLRADYKKEKSWQREDRVENRVGGWRDFGNKKKKRKTK